MKNLIIGMLLKWLGPTRTMNLMVRVGSLLKRREGGKKLGKFDIYK